MSTPGSSPAVSSGCTCPAAQSPQPDYPYWIIKQACPLHDSFTADTVTTAPEPVEAPTWTPTTPGVEPQVDNNPVPPAPSLQQPPPQQSSPSQGSQSGSLLGIIGLGGGS